MKPFLPLFCFLVWLAGALTGCKDDDFSTSASDQPRFSCDTLSFDTVITTVGSSTRMVMLYNQGDKPLMIRSLFLASGGSSGFMVNVDGSPGTEFQEIELDKKDSLYIFVEVNLPEQHSHDPQLVNDEILVLTNGVTQRLVLRAYGQDAVMMRGRTLEQDTLLTAGKPLVVYDSLCVAEGVTLTCEAGARLMFHSGAQLKVRGTLVTNGTSHQKVVFRGDRTDRLFSDLPYDRTPGQWEGIRFYPTSSGNKLTGADIHSTNTAIVCDSTDRSELKLSLLNSVVQNAADYGLLFRSCRVEVLNSLVVNSGRNLVYLMDGDYRFLHTTIVNRYGFAARQGTTVSISSSFTEGGTVDSTRVSFINSIVPPREESTLGGNERAIVFVYHSSVNDEENYVNLNQHGDYIYNFHPTSRNACIDAADPYYSFELPFDFDGYPRLADTRPDAGCYEYREGE